MEDFFQNEKQAIFLFNKVIFKIMNDIKAAQKTSGTLLHSEELDRLYAIFTELSDMNAAAMAWVQSKEHLHYMSVYSDQKTAPLMIKEALIEARTIALKSRKSLCMLLRFPPDPIISHIPAEIKALSDAVSLSDLMAVIQAVEQRDKMLNADKHLLERAFEKSCAPLSSSFAPPVKEKNIRLRGLSNHERN